MKIPTKPKNTNKYKKKASAYSTAEAILDPYVMGKSTAKEVQKKLKAQGMGADLRGKDSEIEVFTLDGSTSFKVQM